MGNAYQLYQHTDNLLKAVNELDLPRLRNMVDDDFGIVDVDPEGKAVLIQNMEEWETYMEKNMIAMQEMHARLAYEIDDYQERVSEDMAFVVVRFQQSVHIPEQEVMKHQCIATIVWKKAGEEWKEARWHCSRLE
jgi:ketosteroid isomerase-like protein